MVFDVNPVILLEKLPVPEPSVVLLSAVVGLVLVLQHTPRAVIVVPPPEVMYPPLVAVVCVIVLIAEVVTEGVCESSSFEQLLESIETNPISRNGRIQSAFIFFIVRDIDS